MASDKIVVLNPTSKGRSKEKTKAKRPVKFGRKAVGVIWNGKPGGDVLLEKLGELLTDRFSLSEVFKVYTKGDVKYALEEKEIDELTKKCDFVLIGVGD